MPRPIAFDLTRLYLGALGSTPRGIDRVDLSVARRLFDDPERNDVGLVPAPWRMGVVRAEEARRITGRVERRWRESGAPSADTAAQALADWLSGASGTPPPPPRATSSATAAARALAAMAAHARGSVLRPAARAVPPGAIYLNTGQVLLGAPWVFGWLDRRPDIRPVFMMHDLIPIHFPEYSGPALARHHARALATAARRAAAMIATSHASAAEIRAGLAGLGRPDMPIHIVPLPVSPSLLAARAAPAGGAPYFVTVGILDQRKNYRLLLHVWRDLVRRLGPRTPKLAILGARGLRTTELHGLIALSPGLSGVVTVASGLASPALRDILAGARALLMPSFTEGFGLPLIEARALGVPVVASDIPAHREVGGVGALYLDPLDGPAWQAAILDLAAAGAARSHPIAEPPQTWARYFAAVLPFLDTL